jgi:hypothetical protein
MNNVMLGHHFGILFEVAADKDMMLVAEMIGEEGGVQCVRWSWRRMLLHWENGRKDYRKRAMDLFGIHSKGSLLVLE